MRVMIDDMGGKGSSADAELIDDSLPRVKGDCFSVDEERHQGFDVFLDVTVKKKLSV